MPIRLRGFLFGTAGIAGTTGTGGAADIAAGNRVVGFAAVLCCGSLRLTVLSVITVVPVLTFFDVVLFVFDIVLLVFDIVLLVLLTFF